MVPTQTPFHNTTSSTPICPAAPPALSQPGFQAKWSPGTVSGMVFGLLTIVIGVITVCQGRQHARRSQGDEEVGSEEEPEEHDQITAGLQAGAHVAMVELQQLPYHGPGLVEEDHRLGTEGEVHLEFVPKVLAGTRTDTDETLVVSKYEGETSEDVGL